MRTETTPSGLRARLDAWRRAGERIALVPTMGNLHAGHFALFDAARAECDRVVGSVFVNPAQFAPDEDFARYPRTLQADAEGLAAHGCDLLFAPPVEVMYPYGVDATTRVHVPEVSQGLEGAQRPSHFDGVATVVAKLLAMVQPDVAVFGRKDYQQWRVVERMSRDLGLVVEIMAVPTVREPDGLALSSRNQYLDAQQRRAAPRLHAALEQACRRLHDGAGFAAAEQQAVQELQAAGFEVDYIAVRNAADLALPGEKQRDGLVVLGAARLGDTRLIDNIELASEDERSQPGDPL